MGGRSSGATWVSAGPAWIGSSTDPCVGCQVKLRLGTMAMPLKIDAQ